MLADTIGVATPKRVRRLVERVSILGPRVGAHLHNTRNTGYASAWAALDGGASVLDASIGGLGGCPFSPNATGNIATEDLVWQLERDGVRTGIDVAALVDVSLWLEELLGRRLEGYAVPRGPLAVIRSREYEPGDLRLMLELVSELWPHGRHGIGYAFMAQRLPHDDWEARLWFDGDVLVGWGWSTGWRHAARPLLRASARVRGAARRADRVGGAGGRRR